MNTDSSNINPETIKIKPTPTIGGDKEQTASANNITQVKATIKEEKIASSTNKPLESDVEEVKDLKTKETEPTPTKDVEHAGTTTSQDEDESKPTIVPSPTPTPDQEDEREISQTNPEAEGMDPEKLFSMANEHRKSIGVSELKKDQKTCDLANERMREIENELANGTLHKGMHDRNLPYWNTENAIAMGPEEVAFNWWINDYIHKKAIENPTYTTSCVACSGVYCVQEFTSYQPK